MARKLHRKEPASRGLTKILGDRTDRALKALSRKSVTDLAVHDVRKRLKEARATLRLLREALGSRTYHRVNRDLRDAARPFAPVRDAKVLTETFESLVPSLDARRHARVVQAVRRFLSDDRRRVRRDALNEQTREISRKTVRRARRHASSGRAGPSGWSAVGPGLIRIYEKCRETLRRARDRPTTERLHEWRKQTKYLRHAIEVALPDGSRRAPSQGRARSSTARHRAAGDASRRAEDPVRQAHRLTDLLGEDHDLATLGARLATAGPGLGMSQRAVRLLEPRIVARRDVLQHEAFAMGRRLFGPSPAVFEARLRASWRSWRRGDRDGAVRRAALRTGRTSAR